MKLYRKLWTQSVEAPRQIFWKGVGKVGAGERGFKVTLWPWVGEGAAVLQFGAEKRTLIQTESVTLPPIHRVVLVDHKSATEINLQTTPRMELYRDGATLYRCTQTETADLGPSSSLHTSRRQLTLLSFQFCVAEGFLFLFVRFDSKTYSKLSLAQFLCSVVCGEVREARGLCFSLAPWFSFTWPRSSTPPSTHSWPTERFTAASAFQMRHSNRKDTPTL